MLSFLVPSLIFQTNEGPREAPDKDEKKRPVVLVGKNICANKVGCDAGKERDKVKNSTRKYALPQYAFYHLFKEPFHGNLLQRRIPRYLGWSYHIRKFC
jgi:hypothetical protein